MSAREGTCRMPDCTTRTASAFCSSHYGQLPQDFKVAMHQEARFNKSVIGPIKRPSYAAVVSRAVSWLTAQETARMLRSAASFLEEDADRIKDQGIGDAGRFTTAIRLRKVASKLQAKGRL